MSKKETWGWELLLDCASAEDKSKVLDQDFLKEWVKELTSSIGMVAYGEPQVVHFAEHEEHLAGNTVIQLLMTSNITAHFCDAHGDLYLNVHSCKEFDPNIVYKNIQETFKFKHIDQRFFTRGVIR